MKKILAELNNTITSLEKLGLYRESDALSNVFVKISQGLIPNEVMDYVTWAGMDKFVLPKQKQLGNIPVNSNAWNKSIQIALGMPPQSADGIFGPKSQQLLKNFKAKYPNDYDARLANLLKPVVSQKEPQMPTPSGYTGP
jgi:hypothetical protein